jgi:hypothetical protein
MKTILFLVSIFITVSLSAQDSWKVIHNNKTLLSTSKEDEVKNKLGVKKDALKKAGTFVLLYTEKPAKKDWSRTIMVYDEKDNLLYKQEGIKFVLKNFSVKDLFDKSKTLRFYTTSLPTDPKAQMQVRVRRIHLVTLTMN